MFENFRKKISKEIGFIVNFMLQRRLTPYIIKQMKNGINYEAKLSLLNCYYIILFQIKLYNSDIDYCKLNPDFSNELLENLKYFEGIDEKTKLMKICFFHTFQLFVLNCKDNEYFEKYFIINDFLYNEYLQLLKSNTGTKYLIWIEPAIPVGNECLLRILNILLKNSQNQTQFFPYFTFFLKYLISEQFNDYISDLAATCILSLASVKNFKPAIYMNKNYSIFKSINWGMKPKTFQTIKHLIEILDK